MRLWYVGRASDDEIIFDVVYLVECVPVDVCV